MPYARDSQITLGTPCFIDHLIKDNKLPAERVRLLIIDEADAMALQGDDMNTSLKEIVRALPYRYCAAYAGARLLVFALYNICLYCAAFVCIMQHLFVCTRQTCAFSATLTPPIVQEIHTFMRDLRQVSIVEAEHTALHGVIKYYSITNFHNVKYHLLSVLQQVPSWKAIIFCNNGVQREDRKMMLLPSPLSSPNGVA